MAIKGYENAAAPTITDVDITSTPVLETGTYGAGQPPQHQDWPTGNGDGRGRRR